MRAFTGAQETYLTKDGGCKPLDFDPARSDLIPFVAGGDGRGAHRTPIYEIMTILRISRFFHCRWNAILAKSTRRQVYVTL